MISSSLVLLLAVISCIDSYELTQPESLIVRPDATLTINCKVSYSVTSSHTAWIRQPAGKGLEWIGVIYHNGALAYKDSLKSKFSITRHTSSNTITLQGKNMKAEDTAVYYCARDPNTPYAAFDYWGKGTSVTVTSAEQSAPKSIFSMSQCTPDSDGFVTIGCLARGFSPADSLSFKWKDTNKDLSEFVQYPAFGRDGDYTKISHMRIRKSDWVPQNPYTCQATNYKGSLEVKVQAIPVYKPTITLLSREEGGRIVLECQLSDYFPEKITVQWLEGDKSVKSQIDKKFQNTDKGEKKYTYISQLSISAPYANKTYTCEATHKSEVFKKEYNTCKAKSLFKPSVQIKKYHLRDIIQENKVTISCVVEAPDNTKVSWLTDSVSKRATKEVKDQANNIVSNLTLSRNEWLTLKSVVCSAKHPCFPEEKDEFKADDIKKDPVVVIRRPFVKSMQTASAVLECVVNGLPSGEVCIIFQANNVDISELSCVDWAPSANIWSLTTHFTIPREHQRNGKTFTCKVHWPFKSWTSKPTGNFFGDPTMELAVVPSVGRSSSDPQKLLCSVTGFNPKIKWLSESREKTGRALDPTMMEDGRVKAFSEISVPQQEWNQGFTYTCQTDNGHSGKTAEKSTSICTAQSLTKPSVQIKKSHLRDIIQEGNVTISCVVEAPDNTEVSWLINGTSKNSTTEHKDLTINNIVSNLTLTGEEFTHSTIVCSAKHPCFPEEKDEFKAVPPPNHPATMYLTVPTKMELDNGTATFMCLAQQFSPKDYAFKWFQDDNALTDAIDKYDKSEKIASVTMYSATSILQIKAEKWKTHSKVKCVFEHKAGNEVIEVENADSCDNVPDIVPHIVPPSVEDMLKNREGWLKCKASPQTPGLKKITIKADNKVIANISEANSENKPDMELNAPIGYEEWSNGTEFTCTIEHSQLAEPKTVTFTRENGKKKRPSVYTLAPPEHKEGETMTLTCYVKDFFPKEVFVSWLADDQPVVNLGYSYNTSLPIKNDQDYSVYSQLTVIDSEWKSGTVFSCVVYHETIDEKLRVLTRSINDNTDKAGVINLSMNTPASCKD